MASHTVSRTVSYTVGVFRNGNIKRQQVVLVDPVTKETFKVLVNVQDVERVKTDPNYKQKMLNSIKKAKNVNSCLEPDKTDDLVKLILTDGFHQVHTLKVPIEVRKQALSDIRYATKLLNGHLSALKSNSEVNQQILCNGLTSEFETSSAALQEGTFAAEKKMYELTLKDQLKMETFTFIVDKESFNRAKTDMVFATKLLDDYKASINKQKLNSLSTDMNKCGDDTAGTENSSDQLQNLIDTYENDDFDEDITKKNTGRYVWSNQETLLLIHLYRQYDPAYSEGKITNKKFWKKISDVMTSKGYDISTTQCTSKMDSLKRAYKSVKDHNAQSGNDKKTCNYYEELDELFQKKPWIKPEDVAGCNMPLGNLDTNKGSANPLKHTRSILEAKKVSYLEESLEIKRLKRTDTENYIERKLSVMEDLVRAFKK